MADTVQLPEELNQATDVLFVATPPFFLQDSSGSAPSIGVYNNVTRINFEQELAAGNPNQYLGVPVLADLLQRGLLSYEEVSEDTSIDPTATFVMFREILRSLDDPLQSSNTVRQVASVAFTGVLMRPPNLEIPAVPRKLHAGDIDPAGSPKFFAELVRHRLNFLKDIAAKSQLSRQQSRKVANIPDAQGNISVERFNEKLKAGLVTTAVLRLLTKTSVGTVAEKLIPLLEASPEDAEVLKKRYIDSSFQIIDEIGGNHELGKMLHTPLSRNARRHILAGDKSGGGHHIPSLDPNYSKIVGEVVDIPAGTNGKNLHVPVALQQRDGKFAVSNFFPSEWSKDEVIEAVTDPEHLIYRSNPLHEGLSISEVVQTRGILMKRVLIEDENGNEVIITAYPVVPIPPAVERRLKKVATSQPTHHRASRTSS